MTIHVLTITHEYGNDYWVCTTEAIAQAYLNDWVMRWWPEQFGTEEPLPEDLDERIVRYFEDSSCQETYELSAEELYTEGPLREDVETPVPVPYSPAPYDPKHPERRGW